MSRLVLYTYASLVFLSFMPFCKTKDKTRIGIQNLQTDIEIYNKKWVTNSYSVLFFQILR